MKKYVALGFCVLMSACTSGSESFSSEPGRGFGWKSLKENHQQIQSMTSEQTVVSPPVISSEKYHIQSGPWTDVERRPERYLRIWFPPHQDGHGNLHEEHAIHTVIQPGQWIIPGHGA